MQVGLGWTQHPLSNLAWLHTAWLGRPTVQELKGAELEGSLLVSLRSIAGSSRARSNSPSQHRCCALAQERAECPAPVVPSAGGLWSKAPLATPASLQPRLLGTH